MGPEKLQKISITREEIREVYDQGPEAIEALVLSLVDTVNKLIDRVDEQDKIIKVQDARIKKHEDQINKNSRNSSKPPSTDSPYRNKKKKKNNLQGHNKKRVGTTLAQVANPDEIDCVCWNPHFHAIVLEGGFDSEGTFFYLPFWGLEKMTEYFRRSIIKIFLEKKLINESFAHNMLSWRHSGFTIDNSVRILDGKSRESLAEYISRQTISLKKIHYESFKGRVLFHTRYNEYFKENLHMFEAADFLAELTQHIPPKGVQLIRRYGLYSSRIKDTWENIPEVAERAPPGWKKQHGMAVQACGAENLDPLPNVDSAEVSAYKKARARLLSKVYEIDPFICPICGAEMKCRDRSSLRCGTTLDVIAIIQKPQEIKRILRHLEKQGRPPPGFEQDTLN